MALVIAALLLSAAACGADASETVTPAPTLVKPGGDGYTWCTNDLSGRGDAAGPPSVLAANGFGLLHYRDNNSHLQEISRANASNSAGDLTANNPGAPNSAGNPFSYFDPVQNLTVVLYRGADRHVYDIYWSPSVGGSENLTGNTVGAPLAAGDPVGWFSTHDNFHHVVYRTGDGHLHDLRWQGQGAPVHRDLTLLVGATPAASDPWPLYDSIRHTSAVVFRATVGHIVSIWDGPNGLGGDAWSRVAGTGLATGRPFAWFAAEEDTQHIVYRGVDNHVYGMTSDHNSNAVGLNVTAHVDEHNPADVPEAAGDPTGGYNPVDKTNHIFYTSGDGRLHDMYYHWGDEVISYADRSACVGGAPDPPRAQTFFGNSFNRPAYYVTTTASGFPQQHLAYLGADGHIHEVVWDWYWS